MKKREQELGDEQEDLNAYHIRLIEQGIKQADAGLTIPHEEVVKRIADLISRSRHDRVPRGKPKRRTS